MTPCASDWETRDSIAAIACTNAEPGEDVIATMLSCSSWNTDERREAGQQLLDHAPHRVQRKSAAALARGLGVEEPLHEVDHGHRGIVGDPQPEELDLLVDLGAGEAVGHPVAEELLAQQRHVLRQLLACPGEVQALAARPGQLGVRPREHGGERVPRHRLQQVLEDLELERLLRVLELVVAAHDDDDAVAAHRRDPLDELEPVHDGHADVDQQDVRALALGQLEGHRAVLRLRHHGHVGPGALDGGLQPPADLRLVVGDQHFPHGYASSGVTRGWRSSTVVPAPGELSKRSP